MRTPMRVAGLGLALMALAALGVARAQDAKPLTEAKLATWVEAQVPEATILASLQKDGVGFAVDEAALGRLKEAGASEAVLDALRKLALPEPAGAHGAAVTYQDVLELLRDGVAEAEVLGRLGPTIFTLDAAQVVELKKAGASEALLAAMRGGRPTPSAGGEVTDLAIVVDCSASMQEKTKEGLVKMEVARNVVSDLVRHIPKGLNVTFVIYGHDKEQKCQAVKVVRPIGPLDDVGRATLINAIRRLPAAGATPIALALRTAGAELAKGEGACGLVLVSDGKETCRGNPSAEVAALARDLDLSFGVNVIGFDVAPEERAGLEAIARAGKGKYYDAATAVEFREVVQALQRTVEVAAVVAPLAQEPNDESEPAELDPAVQALIDQLSDPEHDVRKDAADGLRVMGAKEAVPALARRVSDDSWRTYESSGVRAMAEDESKDAALAALKELAPGRVQPALRAAMKSKNKAVRGWATRELGKAARREGGQPTPPAEPKGEGLDPAVQALVDQLSDKDHDVRKDAADGLRVMGAKEAAPALARRVSDDSWRTYESSGGAMAEDESKDAALAALKELAPDQVQPALLKAMKSKNKAVRGWATRELGKARRKDKE